MVEVVGDQLQSLLSRLPDLQKDHLPSLHTLVQEFGQGPDFLKGYLDFLDELKKLNAPTNRPSFWPLRFRAELETAFLVALDRWGFRDKQRTTLPIPGRPSAIVYLSGHLPVLYRVVGRMSPEVDGMIGAPLPPEYAAAIGYNAAYEQSLQTSSQHSRAA